MNGSSRLILIPGVEGGEPRISFRGVTRLERERKWVARVWNGSKQLTLGRFDTDVAAAQAYDREVLLLTPSFLPAHACCPPLKVRFPRVSHKSQSLSVLMQVLRMRGTEALTNFPPQMYGDLDNGHASAAAGNPQAQLLERNPGSDGDMDGVACPSGIEPAASRQLAGPPSIPWIRRKSCLNSLHLFDGCAPHPFFGKSLKQRSDVLVSCKTMLTVSWDAAPLGDEVMGDLQLPAGRQPKATAAAEVYNPLLLLTRQGSCSNEKATAAR